MCTLLPQSSTPFAFQKDVWQCGGAKETTQPNLGTRSLPRTHKLPQCLPIQVSTVAGWMALFTCCSHLSDPISLLCVQITNWDGIFTICCSTRCLPGLRGIYRGVAWNDCASSGQMSWCGFSAEAIKVSETVSAMTTRLLFNDRKIVTRITKKRDRRSSVLIKPLFPVPVLMYTWTGEWWSKEGDEGTSVFGDQLGSPYFENNVNISDPSKHNKNLCCRVLTQFKWTLW